MLPGVSFSLIDAAWMGGERGSRGAPEGLEVHPGLAGRALDGAQLDSGEQQGWVEARLSQRAVGPEL